MFITFLLAMTVGAAAVEDPGCRPTFHHQDCQKCLFDHAPYLRKQLSAGHQGRRAVAVTVERAMVRPEEPEDFALLDPRFVWFGAKPSEAPVLTRRRANEAARAGAAQDPRPRPPLPTFSDRSPNADLTEVERRTLGITGSEPVRPGDLRGILTIDEEAWTLTFTASGVRRGSIRLPVREVELGYTNTVYEWQWQRVTDAIFREQTPAPMSPVHFISDHSHDMFVRRDGDRTFGYFVRNYDWPSGQTATQMEVALVRPVRREASSTADLIFPRPNDHTEPGGAPPVNLGVIDLGLRLVFALVPKPE